MAKSENISAGMAAALLKRYSYDHNDTKSGK